MGYMHINNLYKSQEILAFKECYALEKIHGTSAHISYDGHHINFFAGGVKHESFVKCFDSSLLEKFQNNISGRTVVFGEAYGGSCQKMKDTYGCVLKFVVFDIKVDDCWLSVPQAHLLANNLGLEFVHYNRITTDMSAVDAERDLPSVQSVRNGIVGDKIREGIVLRPPFEVKLNDGSRVIAKHKRMEFSERKSVPVFDPGKRKIMEDAESIAFEWVTTMRLLHVLDKIQETKDISLTKKVITLMIEDIMREASMEITDNKAVRASIAKHTASLYKKWLNTEIVNV